MYVAAGSISADARGHVGLVRAAPDQRLEPGEPGARVRAEDAPRVADDGVDALALVEEDRDRPVQVVLALPVLPIEEWQGRVQQVAPEDDPVRRDLVDPPDLGRRVAPLEHVDDAAAVANDAAVAARPIQDRRAEGDRGPGPAVGGEQLPEVRRP